MALKHSRAMFIMDAILGRKYRMYIPILACPYHNSPTPNTIGCSRKMQRSSSHSVAPLLPSSKLSRAANYVYPTQLTRDGDKDASA